MNAVLSAVKTVRLVREVRLTSQVTLEERGSSRKATARLITLHAAGSPSNRDSAGAKRPLTNTSVRPRLVAESRAARGPPP